MGQRGSQYNPQHLQQLLQQINLAVQAGHLNPAIMNQKMSPQTLLLLNHLLNSIKTLDALNSQARLVAHDHRAMSSLSTKISSTRQTITSLQNQISIAQTQNLKPGVGDPNIFKPIEPAMNLPGGDRTRLPIFTGAMSG